MSIGIQDVGRQDPTTTINRLLRNLLALVRIKDSRTAYLASAAAECLARLRAEALRGGLPRSLDLAQKPALGNTHLAALGREFVAALGELVEALRAPRLWPLEASIQNAATQVEAAWEALKESA